MNNHFLDFDLFVVPEPNQYEKRTIGKGEKGIAVIFESPQEADLLTNFLAKVLQAAKIDSDKDTFLLPLSQGEDINLSTFSNQNGISHIICFGISPERLGLHFNYQLYTPFVFKKRTFLFTDPLQAIFDERQAGGKRMSGALWKALKEVFLS